MCLYGMAVVWYVVSIKVDSLKSICLIVVFHRTHCDRIRYVLLVLSRYLVSERPLALSQRTHEAPADKRNENITNSIAAQHPTAHSLILIPITL